MSEEEGEEEVGEDVSRKSERDSGREGSGGGSRGGWQARGENCSRLSLWAAIQLPNKDTETLLLVMIA